MTALQTDHKNPEEQCTFLSLFFLEKRRVET